MVIEIEFVRKIVNSGDRGPERDDRRQVLRTRASLGLFLVVDRDCDDALIKAAPGCRQAAPGCRQAATSP